MADDPAAGRVGEVAVGASQQGLDPAHELAQRERLGDVVVGAELEAHDLVELVAAGGQEQDRRLGPDGAQPAEHLEAVDPGQADVEEDEVGRLVGGELEPFLAGAGERDLIPLLLEGVLDPTRNGVLVFDDQDGGCHGAAILHREAGRGAWGERGARVIASARAAMGYRRLSRRGAAEEAGRRHT